MDEQQGAAVDRVIRERRTAKMLATAPLPAEDAREMVDEFVAAAGWAPFHRVAARAHTDEGPLTSPVPWRFHLLDAAGCRALREELLRRGDRSKIPGMLAAATALVQATWLPNPPRAAHDRLFEPTVENMEHVAAAGAAVQTLLLAATARGVPNYWSSGGVLREAQVYRWMGIPEREILLGSVFLFPPDAPGAEVLPGSHRDRRGPPSTWSRWVDLHVDGTRG